MSIQKINEISNITKENKLTINKTLKVKPKAVINSLNDFKIEMIC